MLLVSDEASHPRLQVAALLLCPHMAFPLCMYEERTVSGVFFSSYEDISLIVLGPHLTFIASLKVLSPNTVHIGLRASIYEVCGNTVYCITVKAQKNKTNEIP